MVISLLNNILFKYLLIEGKRNLLAHKLSRDHIVSFKQSVDGRPVRELFTGAVALVKRSMTEGTWNNYRGLLDW